MVVALNLCATIETCSPNMNYFVEAGGRMEFSLIAHFWECPTPPWLLMGGGEGQLRDFHFKHISH